MDGLSDLPFPENRYFSRGYFFVHVSSLLLMANMAITPARVRLSVNNGGMFFPLFEHNFRIVKLSTLARQAAVCRKLVL